MRICKFHISAVMAGIVAVSEDRLSTQVFNTGERGYKHSPFQDNTVVFGSPFNDEIYRFGLWLSSVVFLIILVMPCRCPSLVGVALAVVGLIV